MSRKKDPLPMTDEEAAQHRKALIEMARWNGEHGRAHAYHDPELQAAYEDAKVLS